MGTYLAELVNLGSASDNCPVTYFGLTGDADVAYEYAVLADGAVVRNVDVGHYEGIVADSGYALAAGLGSAVDCGAFANVDAVTNLHVSHLALELEVLRDGAYNGSRKYGAVLADLTYEKTVA